jgi:uncharacterized protein with FMN-binding domain
LFDSFIRISILQEQDAGKEVCTGAKINMKKRYILVPAALIALVLLALAFRSFSRQAEEGLAQLESLSISTPALNTLKDGLYTGTYAAFPVKVTAEVTVSGHRITAVRLLEHRNGQGKAAETLLGKIVENQSLELDAVSGATYSSLVLLKAVELALSP